MNREVLRSLRVLACVGPTTGGNSGGARRPGAGALRGKIAGRGPPACVSWNGRPPSGGLRNR